MSVSNEIYSISQEMHAFNCGITDSIIKSACDYVWRFGSLSDFRSVTLLSQDRISDSTSLFPMSGKKDPCPSLGEMGEEDSDEGLGMWRCWKITDTSGRRLNEKFLAVGREKERVLGLIGAS